MSTKVTKITEKLDAQIEKAAADLSAHADRMFTEVATLSLYANALDEIATRKIQRMFVWAHRVTDAVDAFVDRRFDRINAKLNARLDRIDAKSMEKLSEALDADRAAYKVLASRL